MSQLVYPEESYAIMGACFEVYRDKGAGFLEGVFQECLEIEFSERGVPFESQPKLRLAYKGRPLKQIYTRILSATDESSSKSRQCPLWQTSIEPNSTIIFAQPACALGCW